MELRAVERDGPVWLGQNGFNNVALVIEENSLTRPLCFPLGDDVQNGGVVAVFPAVDMRGTLDAVGVGVRVAPHQCVTFEVKLLEPGPNSSNRLLGWIGIEPCFKVGLVNPSATEEIAIPMREF